MKLLLLIASAALPAAACSAQSCIAGGVEMKPSFALLAMLRDKPLPGAAVRIDKWVPNQDSQVCLEGTTAGDGKFRVPLTSAR